MSMINCPECGKEISDQAEKCINCGYPIQNFIKRKEKEIFINNEKIKFAKCRNCNTQNEADSSFCVGCGKKLRKVFVTVDTLMSKPMQELSQYYCKNCNSQNDYGIKTCQACGNQLIAPQKPKIVYVQQPMQQPQKKKKPSGGIYCPFCYSTQFQILDVKKKLSIGKAVVGNTIGGIFGPTGAILGAATGINGKKGKTKFVCNECGKTWEKKV